MRLSVLTFCHYLAILLFLMTPILHVKADKQSQQREKLMVVMRVTPAAWHFDKNETRGIDYDLLVQFSEWLDLQLQISPALDTKTALEALCNPQAQLATGLLALPASMKTKFRTSPDYGTAQPQLIRHFTQPQIKSTDSLIMRDIEIGSEPAHLELLTTAWQRDDLIQRKPHKNVSVLERIDLIDRNFIEYTIVDSHAIKMTKRFYPRVKEGIYIGPELTLNWVFGQCADDRIVESSKKFFIRAKADGVLEQIFDRYLGHATQLDYPEKLTFLEKVEKRLEKYKPSFIRVAHETAMNWTLLAALSYQESRWVPDARSPSGVEGLMMLTLNTAEQFGVENRKDPDQSIRGSAHFLLDLKKRLPIDVKEPDRTWFALAAYNAGPEKVRNAMNQARKQKLNSSMWINIRDFLNTRHLPPTESTAVKPLNNPYFFVYNVRAYQDLLSWNDQELRFYEHREKLQKEPPAAPVLPAPMQERSH